MTQIQLPSGCYLLVEIPTVAFGIDVNNYGNSSELMYMVSMEDIAPEVSTEESLVTKQLPGTGWKVIGRADELNNGDPDNNELLEYLAQNDIPLQTTLILKKIQP